MMPPEVARRQLTPGEAEIELWLDPSLFWFRGHFAAQPLLPGVAQVEWAVRAGIRYVAPGMRFQGLQVVKFQAPLLPGTQIMLTLEWQEKRQLLSFRYLRRQGDQWLPASNGKIRLCP